MRITGKPHRSSNIPATAPPLSTNPPPHSDLNPPRLPYKPQRRKSRTRPRFGAPVAGRRSSRPETPLLKWKTDEKEKNVNIMSVEDDEDTKSVQEGRRRTCRREVNVSARKLAAGLWRLQLPESVAVRATGGGVGVNRRNDELGFQGDVCHVRGPHIGHRSGKVYGSDAKDFLQSPSSVSGMRNDFFYKLEPSFQFSNSGMEGATKWDPVSKNTADHMHRIYGNTKLLDQQVTAASMISALEAELEQARARIVELETERRSSKKKLEHFLKKVDEEKAVWRKREHEKIRAFIDDIRSELSRERKNRQRMEIVNSKLVDELAEAKLSAKRFMQEYEKERKTRELVEEVCDELAKEIGEDKTEADALKRETMRLREEVEDEKKMLQMAEVWREERVQMKLVDAKVALEERYSQMNKLIADLEKFLQSRSANPDVNELRQAELLQQAAASINFQEIKEFTYEPPNADDIFSVFEEVNCGENNEREIEPSTAYSPNSHASKIRTVSPEVNAINKEKIQRYSNAFTNHNDDIEDDESGWETVSNVEDQGSSFSPDGSAPSVNKMRRDSNVSGSGMELEEHNAGGETPVTEISEVCSIPSRPTKKVSSIVRLWRSGPTNGESYKVISVEGINGRLSNGRISNGGIISPDQGSGKGEISPPDLMGQWSSPDTGNPHITRGMKGCIEWPRGAQKHSLKAKLLEARMESQKVQLRHVLKQKM